MLTPPLAPNAALSIPQDTAKRSPLLRIMYSSIAQESLNAFSLANLLVQSLANNARDEITGMLLVDGLLNLQYIEGPEPAVRKLWHRLGQDTRHHCIVQLYECEGMLPRLFEQWAMLHGKASRAEMLGLIRNAYRESDAMPKPAWSLAIAPLIVLLDNNYRHAYSSSAS